MEDYKPLEEFVEDVFDYYSIDKKHFFYEEGYVRYDKHLVIDDRLSRTLGMTIDEIKNMDIKAAKRWGKKYPFFRYYKKYCLALSKKSFKEGTTFSDIVSSEIHHDFKKIELYNIDNIKRRLRYKLKKIDEIIPGSIHKNSTIKGLTVNTNYFFSFEHMPKMLKSFIDIYNTVETLFFKALHEDLTEAEIMEYNFLVLWFKMTDSVMTNRIITYNFLCEITSKIQNK